MTGVDAGSVLFCYPGAVEYERPDTWPTALRTLLEREFELLRRYEIRRAEIALVCEEEVMARINVPHNDDRAARDEVVRRADKILDPEKLLGFHCTRLTPGEIDRVRHSGLETLSSGLLRRRLDDAVAEGSLTEDLAAQLWAGHQAEDRYRAERTCFVNCRSVLRFESDVGRLFRSWGGEALYWGHEHQEDTGAALRAIGTPAIVVTAIPVGRLRNSFRNIGERFVWKHLRDRGIRTGHGADIETFVTAPTGPDCILEIITFDDDRFEQATGCSSWNALLM
jgi:hypothetical protein